MGDAKEMLTDTEAARVLGFSVSTLRSWRRRKMGPSYVRMGGAIRYRRCDLDRFVEASVVQPANNQQKTEDK